MNFGIIILIIILGAIVIGAVILKIGLPGLIPIPTPVETLDQAKKNSVNVPAHQPPIESNTPDTANTPITDNTPVQQQHNIPGTGYSEWNNFLTDPSYINPIISGASGKGLDILYYALLLAQPKAANATTSISSAINLCNITSNCIGIFKINQQGIIFESTVTGAIYPKLLRDTMPPVPIAVATIISAQDGQRLNNELYANITRFLANNPHSVLLKNSKVNGIVGLPAPTNQYGN
jgi:hypothetical protein